MPRRSITIEHRMNVIRGGEGGFVLVPGLEPTSTLTSTRMTAEMDKIGLMGCSIVPVKDILNAIPGSRIEYIANNGWAGAQKLLVLPAFSVGCPCSSWPDFYQILKDLCRPATESEIDLILGDCDSFPIDRCDPDPRWRGEL